MRILLDENIDHRMVALLPVHQVDHVRLIGLSGIQNGKLLAEIENRDYEIFVTVDKQMRHQQNFANRMFGMIVLDVHPNKLSTYGLILDELNTCISGIGPGEIRVVAVNAARD